MIADLNPIAVIATAVLFGGLMNGSFSLLVDTNVPTTFIYALQAIFLLFLLVARVFSTYRIKRNSNDR
jgi:simple sugar transport system permease protein